jgi:signal transduction histidine kinase
MQSDVRPSRLNLRHKLILTHVAVTLAAILIAEGAALGALALLARWPTPAERALGSPPARGLHVALVTVGAALVGSLLGAWASRGVTHRLRHTLEISRAWLRGNLSLRIADPMPDDLGLLAERLDLLAEHLEQDEQDLDELRETNTRLTDQVRALAVVEERNRLARELHDGVKQHLFSLAMTASGIRTRFDALPDVPEEVPSELAEMVREIETAAQAAQRETTRLIEDLRPGSIQEQGLSAALNDYTLLLGAQEHILIYLEVQGSDALLPPSMAEALYRVAQEALHNVGRHARATRADVHLRCAPTQATLTIRDNGVGFDTSRPRQGLGLANMQERMMAVGGRLAVESQAGMGTTVLAEVALPHPWGTSLDTRAEIAGPDKDRPNPTIENWSWLGQKLVIPVGQTRPWLPADRVHLRRPLVEPSEESLTVKKDTSFLGLKKGYVLHVLRASPRGQHRALSVRVHHSRSGYEWEADGASWALRRIRGLSGRVVLTRNGQPLAAMQYQGRLLNTWSEAIYDGRGYRLSRVKNTPGNRVLVDAAGDECLLVEGGDAPQATLRRALPLPLLVMAVMRILDEDEAVATTTSEETEAAVSSQS